MVNSDCDINFPHVLVLDINIQYIYTRVFTVAVLIKLRIH